MPVSPRPPAVSGGAPSTGGAPPPSVDLVVVGGGIVGLSSAAALAAAHPGTSVAVLEAEPRLAAHQSSHNSGVVHAGIYYRPGTLKAQLCVAGAHELRGYCADHGIALREVGKVIVATEPDELPRLRALAERAERNAVPGLRMVGGDELREIEPHVVGIGALHSPSTAVVDYAEVAHALASDVAARGGTVHTSCAVRGMREEPGGIVVAHAHGETRARGAVVCAGAFADRIGAACDVPSDPRLVPFRGAYMALRAERRALVRGLVYPVPDPDLPFLGMHFTRTIRDAVIVGPTALMVGAADAYRLGRLSATDLRGALAWPGTWRLMRRWWRTGLHELAVAASRRSFLAEARRYVPEVGAEDLEPAVAGVRAQPVARDGALVDEFVIAQAGRALHVRSAPSPAATSALPLGRHIAERAATALGLPRTTIREVTP
jgi:2-hydroxyglutarate dehydrogenase